MRNSPSVGSGTVLPATEAVKTKKRKSAPAAPPPKDPPTVPTPGPRPDPSQRLFAEALEQGFFLPGIAAHSTLTVAELLGHVCGILHCEARTIRAVLERQLENDPVGAAELAEVLAISEEVCSAGGISTDLEGRAVTDWTDAQRFAAKAKAHALSHRREYRPPEIFKVRFVLETEGEDDYQKWGELPFVPAPGMQVSVTGNFWKVEIVWWVPECPEKQLLDGYFECTMKEHGPFSHASLLKQGWQLMRSE